MINFLYLTISKISTKNLKIMNPTNEIMHLKSFTVGFDMEKPDAMRISAGPTTPATKRCSTIKVHRGIIAGKRRDQTRRERGLTQEELAARLFITRQAVSRWETGATEPGIDMIKLIARELDVPVTRLLDMPEHYCQSCGMMFTEPDQRGHEADGTETDEFCRWCYDKGAYTYETTMEEMIEDCAPRMAQNMDWSVDECASLLGAILPTLRRWRKSARPNE